MGVFNFPSAFVCFGVISAVALALVFAAPNEFAEELNFINSLVTEGNFGNFENLLNFENVLSIEGDEGIKIKSNPSTRTPEMIEKHGYPSETHTIKTEDGYLLGIHRIPNPGKPVVFLQHGLLSSSADWVVLGPGKSLALLLHDAGYDVWMGNSRGNTYSRHHISMTPSQAKFWEFSWHEIGVHDLPACIDTILNKTGHKDLVYVGHSQGTTSFFVLMSELPKYNEKVRAMIALAPVAYLNKMKSFPMRLVSLATDQLAWLTKLFGLNEFLPSNFFIQKISKFLCASSELIEGLCTNTLFLMCGFDSEQFNKTMMPEILDNVPAGASTRQIVHYGQQVKKDPVFNKFDHGWFKNLRTYDSWAPPSYDLSKITTDVHLYYGYNDIFAVPEGVLLLHKALPNSKECYRVPFDKFNHFDFLYAKDAKELIYDTVMDTVKKIVPPTEGLSEETKTS